MSSGGEVIVRGVWRSRGVVLFSAFGLVGVGAAIGAGSVYVFYIRNKLQDLFRAQSLLSQQLQTLKREVEQVNRSITHSNGSAVPSHSSTVVDGEVSVVKKSSIANHATRRVGGRRTVRFRDGYETADDDEYITASSDSDLEFETLSTGLDSERKEESSDHLDIPSDAEEEIINLLKEADKLLDGDGSSQHEAYILLGNSKDRLEHLCGFWWRFAKATYMEAAAAKTTGDKELRKSLTLAGCSRAEKALNLNQSSPNAHKWFAITLGSKGDFVPINEKIQNGYVFKEHVDQAIQLNPTDPSLHYLLGRFCFEVSQLGWMERKIASTLFSSPPNSTPEEALTHFQESERCSKGKPLKDNRLFTAKCYIALGKYEEAANYLKMTIEMPNVSSSDGPVHEEALQLFKQYSRYLNE